MLTHKRGYHWYILYRENCLICKPSPIRLPYHNLLYLAYNFLLLAVISTSYKTIKKNWMLIRCGFVGSTSLKSNRCKWILTCATPATFSRVACACSWLSPAMLRVRCARCAWAKRYTHIPAKETCSVAVCFSYVEPFTVTCVVPTCS